MQLLAGGSLDILPLANISSHVHGVGARHQHQQQQPTATAAVVIKTRACECILMPRRHSPPPPLLLQPGEGANSSSHGEVEMGGNEFRVASVTGSGLSLSCQLAVGSVATFLQVPIQSNWLCQCTVVA